MPTAQEELALVREELRVKQEELTQALASAGLRTPDATLLSPGAIPAAPVMQLRPPAIDRYSGDRSATLDFSLSIDRRLRATDQYSTMAGLEFAVGHFTGDAATWFRYLSARCPEVNS